MIRRILSILFFIFSLTHAYTQDPVKLVSNSVGLISFGLKNAPGKSRNGTGTLILKFISETKVKVLLITNKHVLPQKGENDSLSFSIRNIDHNSSTKYFIFKIAIFDRTGSYQGTVKSDPGGTDLAVIDVTDFFLNNSELSETPRSLLNERMLLPRDSLYNQSIDIGTEVYFIGYPNFLFDKRNISPLLRTGVIASVPYDDYYFSDEFRTEHYFKFNKEILPDKLSGFLIDANVFRGSSGSLVFTKPDFISIRNRNAVEFSPDNYDKVKLLGIISDSYFSLTDSTVQRVQLGGVISANQIINTLKLFK